MREALTEMFNDGLQLLKTIWERPELRYLVLFILLIFVFRGLNRWLSPKLRRKKGLRLTSEPYFSPQEEMAGLLLMLLVLVLLIFFEKGWSLRDIMG